MWFWIDSLPLWGEEVAHWPDNSLIRICYCIWFAISEKYINKVEFVYVKVVIAEERAFFKLQFKISRLKNLMFWFLSFAAIETFLGLTWKFSDNSPLPKTGNDHNMEPFLFFFIRHTFTFTFQYFSLKQGMSERGVTSGAASGRSSSSSSTGGAAGSAKSPQPSTTSNGTAPGMLTTAGMTSYNFLDLWISAY